MQHHVFLPGQQRFQLLNSSAMVSNSAKFMVVVFSSCVVFRAYVRHMGSSEAGKKHDVGQVWHQMGEVACDDCKIYTGGLLD